MRVQGGALSAWEVRPTLLIIEFADLSIAQSAHSISMNDIQLFSGEFAEQVSEANLPVESLYPPAAPQPAECEPRSH